MYLSQPISSSSLEDKWTSEEGLEMGEACGNQDATLYYVSSSKSKSKRSSASRCLKAN